MSSSASSTDSKGRRSSPFAETAGRPTSRLERAIARVLVIAMLGVSPGTGWAGDEFDSANQATMQDGTIDNAVSGETTITSFVENGETQWEGGLDQPADNVLIFDLLSSDSTHLNIVGGDFAAHLNGQVRSANATDNHTIIFSSPYGVFIGSEAVIDVGTFVAVGAELAQSGDLDRPNLELTGDVINQGIIRASQDVLLYGSNVINIGEIYTPAGQLLMLAGESLHYLDAGTITEALINPMDFVALLGGGIAYNGGYIEAEEASLIGRRVINYGHIEINDGSLMIAAGDAVLIRDFDNPVVIKIPNSVRSNANTESDYAYAIENKGTINAGTGHVRLSAADALGWGIRQGTGTAAEPGVILARTIEIDGGKNGRVELSGVIDASNENAGETGGSIDITGETIVLSGATIDASGDAGGGTIQIGGEQQGRGELQRARALVMDAGSSVRANALRDGNGGRVILFSEDFTHLTGAISARGGDLGGDGGFIETSGLRNFYIENTPDASAPAGQGGEWLIDPYTINIVLDASASACVPGESCLGNALEQILRPSFDSGGFDGILRTADPDGTMQSLNNISVDLLVRALGVGTRVTLSTEANSTLMNPAEVAGMNGDINILTDILIPDAQAAQGTRATLTLRAAGDINVDADVLVGDASGNTANMALSLNFFANDQSQRDSTADFGADQLNGSVNFNSNVRTGGGDVVASGISIHQATGTVIETDGGIVDFSSGSSNELGLSTLFLNDQVANAALPDETVNPGIFIDGTIDTSRPTDAPGVGGAIILNAEAVGIQTSQSGNDQVLVDTGRLELTSNALLASGGGSITLAAGRRNSNNAGNALLNGALLDSSRAILDDAGNVVRREGGDITIDANRLDPNDSDLTSVDIAFVPTDAMNPLTSIDEGGRIEIQNDTTIRTRGGDLTIGSATTQTIAIQGILNTTQSTILTDGSDDLIASVDQDAVENGLLSIVAADASGIDVDAGRFGESGVTIGGAADATLISSGITIDARNVTFSDGTNAVTLLAAGDTRSTISTDLVGVAFEEGRTSFTNQNEIRVDGDYAVTFNENTTLTAEQITISAAAAPEQQNESEIAAPTTTRLTFAGNDTNGTRLNADEILITVGDGTTSSENLLGIAEVDDPDFDEQRTAVGSYSGLQLRDQSTGFRPGAVSILQDGDFTVASAAGTDVPEIYFGGQSGSGTDGAFGTATIGANGQRILLESRDGTLRIDDAAGLNSAPSGGLTPGSDAGRSWVTLNGGLLLKATAGDLDPNNSVEFGTLASLFDLESLTITTPRSLLITDDLAPGNGLVIENVVGTANELVLQAGRTVNISTNVDGETLGGTLTIEEGTELRARDRLALLAADRGFGDLVFESSGGTPTKLRSNSIELRAGGGDESLNTNSANYAEIQGASEVAYRDDDDNVFQSNGTTARSFSFRQDAGIDAATHLPTLNDFGLTGPTDTFGTETERVAYSLRSDYGSVDLRTGGFEDDRQIQDTMLTLIGLQGSSAAILVDDAFAWNGAALTLGGVSSFNYTDILSRAFNASGAALTAARIRLRSGLNDPGNLTINSGITIRAPHIELIAGDGFGDGLGTEGIPGNDRGSVVSTTGAFFDLRDFDSTNPATFVFQQDENYGFSSLPSASQFTNGVLPSILALRNDAGIFDLLDPDFTALPLDLSAPARLILEARVIQLSASAGNDLKLTGTTLDPMAGDPLENLRLRLRSDTVILQALGASSELDPMDALSGGHILAGDRSGMPVTAALGDGDDADFNDSNLIIEGYDLDAEFVATTNLSEQSQDAADPTRFDLEDGRGPVSLSIRQDANFDADELPDRWHIAGHLGAGTNEEANGDPLATQLRFNSTFGDVQFSANEVGGSDLQIGNELVPTGRDITFLSTGGPYDLNNVFAFAINDIFVDAGSDISVDAEDGTIQLEAGVLIFQPSVTIDTDNDMGELVFRGSSITNLLGNTIVLRAGPATRRLNPNDADNDGDNDIDDGLATIDFTGLGSITQSDASQASSLTVSQAANFDTTVFTAALGAGEWDDVDLNSVEGSLNVTSLEALGAAARNVRLGRVSNREGVSVTIDRTDDTVADIFSVDSGFQGTVRIASNDIHFIGRGATQLELDSPNIQLVSDTFRTLFESDSDRGRLSSDPDVLDRAQVTITQDGDFGSTRLVRPSNYSQLLNVTSVNIFETFRRSNLERIGITLKTTGDNFVFGDNLRDDTRNSNLTIESTSTDATENQLTFDFDQLAPGVGDYAFNTPDADPLDFPALALASLDTIGFDEIVIDNFNPTLPDSSAPRADVTISTTGDQAYSGHIILRESLTAIGRDILFGGDVFRDIGAMTIAPTDVGLLVQTDGEVLFQGNLGWDSRIGSFPVADPNERLGSLWVVFDANEDGRTPVVQFGTRSDSDDDGIDETAENSDQGVFTEGDIVFVSTALSLPDNPRDLEDGDRIELLKQAIGNVTDLTNGTDGLAEKLANYRAGATPSGLNDFTVGRENLSGIATIGKGNGSLTFQSAGDGDFVMGSGERLAVGGNLSINHSDGIVALGDVAAVGDSNSTPGGIAGIFVEAAEIGLVRRNPGVTNVADGASTPDGGAVIMANSIDFGLASIMQIGAGKNTRFGLENPLDSTLPAFFRTVSASANRPGNGLLTAADFSFSGGGLLDQVVSVLPTGASRSELSGAFGPTEEPIETPLAPNLPPLDRPERLLELDVDARPTAQSVQIARVKGAAIIDDLALAASASSPGAVPVTGSRLDAVDAEAAIELYESLFGNDGERAGEVRIVLQEALDRYLETTRTRRVIGFELRRFVKNRPSTLLEAYATLDRLDSLFRYHRRLGLSPGEFRRIQSRWLESIQPEGISLTELSEAIHPSRYVRGSDILDIFGR